MKLKWLEKLKAKFRKKEPIPTLTDNALSDNALSDDARQMIINMRKRRIKPHQTLNQVIQCRNETLRSISLPLLVHNGARFGNANYIPTSDMKIGLEDYIIDGTYKGRTLNELSDAAIDTVLDNSSSSSNDSVVASGDDAVITKANIDEVDISQAKPESIERKMFYFNPTPHTPFKVVDVEYVTDDEKAGTINNADVEVEKNEDPTFFNEMAQTQPTITNDTNAANFGQVAKLVETMQGLGKDLDKSVDDGLSLYGAYVRGDVVDVLKPVFWCFGDVSQILGHADYEKSLILAYKIPTQNSTIISFLYIPTFSKQKILFDKKTNLSILKKEITPAGLEYLGYVLRYAKLVQNQILEELN